MIIDVHTHIGNILYPSGGDLIFQSGIKFPPSVGLHLALEKALYRETIFMQTVNKIFPMYFVNFDRRKNFAATLENFKESLLGTEIERCVCAPIAPYNTYENILAARRADQRIIAFTSPDFTIDKTNEKLSEDLNEAAGVKIHPIIQEIEADSKRVMESLDAISAFSKPVLLHSGKARYYTPREKKKRYTSFASIDRIERLIAAFPNVKFIVGHAGLDEIRSVIDLLPKYKNAYVDTSFQPPEAVRALISAFGGDKVMFASDWPYGLRLPAIQTVEEACGDDLILKKAVFYDNASEILNIPEREKISKP